MIAFWEKNFLTEGLTNFMEFLNSCIYGLVSVFCGLFSELSNVILFNDTVVEQFTRRIYVVLGIYMLFKLAISLLNSIINPDNFLDKEKGMQKIITRSVMALAMLVLVPSIFSFALEQQDTIARAVPKIIIGAGGVDNMEGQGEILASTALKAFIIPNKQCYPEGSVEYQSVSGDKARVSSLDDVLDLPSKTCDNNKKQFAYEFNSLVSLVAGIFMVVSLASYCVDIAIRCIKLGLLQLLAPIPIISYIDPKSEKDGAFGHWVKESISTYLELFIKLGILYFIIFILAQIASDDGGLLSSSGVNNSSNPFVLVFLIIGAFFFMGKAADFICNILGVKRNKDSGSFIGKALGLMAGGAIGAAGGLIAGGGLGGMAAGALNGLGSGVSGKPLGAFNKGREISALMQGKEKPSSLIQNAQDSLFRRQAAKMGITDDTLETAKKARDNASSRFDVAQSLLQQAPDGSMIEWDGKQYTKEQFSKLVYDGKDSLNAEMKKRASVYDEMKAQGAKWKVGKAVETYSDKYNSKKNDYKPDPDKYNTPSYKIIPPVTPSTAKSSGLDETVSDISNAAGFSTPNLGDQIAVKYNNFEEPTREEHRDRQAELNSVFFDPTNSAYLDAVEAEAAANEKRTAQQNAGTSHTTASGIILNATEDDFKAARDANNNNNR